MAVQTNVSKICAPAKLKTVQTADWQTRRGGYFVYHWQGAGDPFDTALMAENESRLLDAARALAVDPVLVLADEPTANLDTENGRQIMDLMVQLNEETGTTFVFATHDPRVFPFARRVVEVRDGKVAENSQHA